MTALPLEFLRLSELRPSLDGKRIAFRIECRDGVSGDVQSADISCAVGELTDVIAYLAHGAVAAAANLNSPPPRPAVSQTFDTNPLPAQGIGFGAGRSPDETLLLVHLAGFDLVFSVPSSALARVAPELSRMTTTLSASGTKPQ